MDTTIINKTVFIHHATLAGGEVEIRNESGWIKLEGNELLELVANYVRSNKIGELEDASDKELLGF